MTNIALSTPTLHTARLLLRPFTAADTDAIYALMSNATVLRYWDAPPWQERSRADGFIAQCQKMAQEGFGVRLAIERSADQSFIGWCAFQKWEPEYRSATIGYCFAEAAWGQGFATEAAGAVLHTRSEPCAILGRHAQPSIRACAGKTRLCARRHAARILHRQWRGLR